MYFLIVEDDALVREMLHEFIAPYGDCDVAHDGEEGIKAFKVALKKEKPYDLIFLDIILPGMNGYETLEAIRAHEYECGITGLDGAKVVITSSLDDQESIMGAFHAGCEGYIKKPVTQEKIIQEANRLGIDLRK